MSESDPSLVDAWNPKFPFNELPELPPHCELETKEILKRCIAAHKALAELKVAGGLIPNPGKQPIRLPRKLFVTVMRCSKGIVLSVIAL